MKTVPKFKTAASGRGAPVFVPTSTEIKHLRILRLLTNSAQVFITSNAVAFATKPHFLRPRPMQHLVAGDAA